MKKCKNDIFVFDGDAYVTKALDFLLKLKGEERKVKNKILEYNLQHHAHNGSGFDTWIVSNNLPCDKHIVDNIKNGNGIVCLGVFDGYIQNVKRQSPQYLLFRCLLTHLNYSLRKFRKIFILQKNLLKTEMNLDEVYSDTWKD